MPTDIQWTDEVWNCVRGCSRVSSGCGDSTGGGCYAERQAFRFSGPVMPYEGLVKMTPKGPRWTGKVVLVEDKLQDPLRWKKPRRIFVNSMSDLFHEALSDEQIDRVFAVMCLAKQHTFQVLTKRPKRMLAYFSDPYHMNRTRTWALVLDQMRVLREAAASWPLPNVWLGTSVEDQKTADERIPLLLQTPAAVRWISAEPLLAPINLNSIACHGAGYVDALSGRGHDGVTPDDSAGPSIDWVVAGGESGPKARPMHPDWARSLRDQCVAAGVPFFFKQWGEWIDNHNVDSDWWNAGGFDKVRNSTNVGSQTMHLVGKKVAGRLLDGVEWNEFPEVKEFPMSQPAA